HDFQIMGNLSWLASRSLNGKDVIIKYLAASVGDQMVVGRPPRKAIVISLCQHCEYARITSIPIGQHQFRPVTLVAEVSHTLAVVAEVTTGKAAGQSARASAKRGNVVDRTVTLCSRLGWRREVDQRPRVRRPARIKVRHVVTRNLQWWAAGQQPHPNLWRAHASGERDCLAIR